jgi:hypothetical protein
MDNPTELPSTKTATVAPLPSGAPLPAHLHDPTMAAGSAGISFEREDQDLSRIYLLQTNSPQCDKRGSNYVEGAEPGHFYLRNALNPIHDGEAGITAIFCHRIRVCSEWKPMRQGLVGYHAERPADVESRMLPQDGQQRRTLVRTGSGNVIREDVELYLITEGRPCVLTCYSTRLAFARQLNTHFLEFKHPQTGAVLPSFARKYRLTTKLMNNALGQWFGLKFTDLGWVSAAEWAIACEFSLIVAKGKLRVEPPIHDGA